jgi:hypothetical protein
VIGSCGGYDDQRAATERLLDVAIFRTGAQRSPNRAPFTGFISLRQHLECAVCAGKYLVVRTQVESIGEIILGRQDEGKVDLPFGRKTQKMKGKSWTFTRGQAVILMCGETDQNTALMVSRELWATDAGPLAALPRVPFGKWLPPITSEVKRR